MRHHPSPGTNTLLPGASAASGAKPSREKGKGDIYLSVLLKQKRLTSPQSFINCSFQMCQRGKGLLGRLKRAERERRDNRLLGGDGAWAAAAQGGKAGHTPHLPPGQALVSPCRTDSEFQWEARAPPGKGQHPRFCRLPGLCHSYSVRSQRQPDRSHKQVGRF